MRYQHYVGIVSLVAVGGLLTAGALVVGHSHVPTHVIASSVTHTSELIERAWQLPVAATFQRKISWQSNGSRCGPAAVANAYGSLGEKANTEAKVLAGTGRCWTGICMLGLTLDELAEVARANTGRKITVLRDLNEDQFREHMLRTNDPSRRYVVNFSRQQIFGAGVGHHSPIGGYLEADDLVFVLDVNSDYQPWLVERKRLFAAVNTLDGDKKRGLLLIE
jgi:Phytochelatin synthase